MEITEFSGKEFEVEDLYNFLTKQRWNFYEEQVISTESFNDKIKKGYFQSSTSKTFLCY